MKSGVVNYATFIADIKNLSVDYNKAEVAAFFKKYAELFSRANAINTIFTLLQNKTLVDVDCAASLGQVKYIKILINILHHWEKPESEIDRENAGCVVYCIHLLSTKYINDLFTLLLTYSLPLEKGQYSQYLNEIKTSYKLLEELNASFMGLIEMPINVFSFEHPTFKTVFRENILSRMLEGIVTSSKVAYLLHTMGGNKKTQTIMAILDSQLKLIEKNIKNYCKVAMIKSDVAHKQLVIAKQESDYFKSNIAKPQVVTQHHLVLQYLERLNGEGDSEIEHPYSTTRSWSDNLATILEKVNDAKKDNTFKEQQPILLKLIFKHLPHPNLTVGDLKHGILQYTNAKQLCLELRNRYLEKAKKPPQDLHKRVMFDVIIAGLEALIKKYILIINDLNKLKGSLPVCDLIQEILELPFELEGKGEAYRALYEKYREKYFNGDENSLKTLEAIIAGDSANTLLTDDAYFRIYHFTVRVLPSHITEQHSRLFYLLWHHFSNRCVTTFTMWNKNKILLGFNTFFIDDVEQMMLIYKLYKKHYQLKRASQIISLQEQYDEALRYSSIEAFYAGFLCDIGDEERFNAQRSELNSHLASDIQESKKLLQRLMATKDSSKEKYDELDKKLKKVSSLSLSQTLTNEAIFFRLLQTLKGKLAICRAQVEEQTINRTVGEIKIFTTPLMLLEDVLRNPQISVASMELLFTACDYVNEEAFVYERRSFFAQMCVLLQFWRNNINHQNKSAIDKLIFEQLTELLEMTKELYDLIPEIKEIPEVLVDNTRQFIDEIANLNWDKIEDQIPSLCQRYQSNLFLNRENLFLTVSRIPFYLYPKTTFETDMKVVHVLIKLVVKLETTLGSMDLLVNELYLAMFRSICNSQITLCVNLHEKKVAKGHYRSHIESVEQGMALLEQYMPTFEERHPCFKLDSTQEGFTDYWQNLKSLCDVYLMYGVVCVMQLDFKKAKKSVAKSQKFIATLKEHAVTLKQADYIQQLERCGSDLVGHWVNGNKQRADAGVWSKAYHQLLKCEKQFEGMLTALHDVNRKGALQPMTLSEVAQGSPIQGFMQVIEALFTLPKVKSHLAKKQFTRLIDTLRDYEKRFNTYQDESIEPYCIGELIAEKLAILIPRLEAALPLLPEIVAVSPPMDRLCELFERSSATEKPSAIVVSKPKKILTPKFIDDTQPKRLPPAMALDDPKIQELITEAENIPASLDDASHYFLFEAYKGDFNGDESVKSLMKAAVKKLNTDVLKASEKDLQQKVNLAHFLLMYFAQDMKQNPKIKIVCLESLWKSLNAMLTQTLQSCLENRVELGECNNILVHSSTHRSLYEYYALQAEVITNPMLFKPIASELFEQLDKIDLSSKELRKALTIFYQDELMKTLVEVTQPSEPAVVLVNRTPHLVKELRLIGELSVENINKLTRLCVELREAHHHWQSAEFFKLFQSWLTQTVNRFKKPYCFADCLTIELLQRMQTCCDRHLTVELKPGSEDKFESEVELVAQLEKLQIKSEPILKVPDWVKQLMVQLKQHPEISACHLVGGAIRDLMLNIVPHDYDFTVECSVADFIKCFPDAYQPAPHKRPELFRFRELDAQGLAHDIVCIKGECPYVPDLTINSYRWDGITLIAPDDNIADLDKPYLIFKGDSTNRFKSDPSMIFRAIRLVGSTGKYLQLADLKALKECAYLATSIEMGLYLGSLAPVFLRSLNQAYLNIKMILRNDLLSCLLPRPLCDDPVFVNSCHNLHYLHQSVFELYMAHVTPYGVLFNQDTKYELLAIFLLPVLMNMKPNTRNKNELINEVVNDYCHYFQGFATTNTSKHHTAFKVKTSLSRRLAKYVLPEPVVYFIPRLTNKGK